MIKWRFEECNIEISKNEVKALMDVMEMKKVFEKPNFRSYGIKQGQTHWDLRKIKQYLFHLEYGE